MVKALVIEDNKDIRENIVEILGLAGYEVIQAGEGKTGVELATKHLPDIILCDIMMPELDGYGVLYMLNKNEATGTIPFIFITAKSERLELRKGMEMGADDYLTKPFDAMELLNAIETRLKKKGLQRSFYSKSLEILDGLVPRNEGLAELKKMITERKIRPYKKKQVVYYEQDVANGIFLVVSGKIKTVKLGEDGRELMTGIYTADDFLAINIILSENCYAETATAMEDSEVCFFPKSQLEILLRTHPDVAGRFLKILSNEIRDKDAQLIQLAYQSVRKKIAQAIIRLSKNQNDDGTSIQISRDDLAALSGTASETVSRTLTEFKNECLIEKKGSFITILDHDKINMMRN